MIGLDGIILSTAEANIFDDYNFLFQQPDGLMFDPSTKTLYQWEYKCHSTHSQDNHALSQLRKRYDVLKNIFVEWDVVKVYVHDNYIVEYIN